MTTATVGNFDDDHRDFKNVSHDGDDSEKDSDDDNDGDSDDDECDSDDRGRTTPMWICTGAESARLGAQVRAATSAIRCSSAG